MPRGATLRQAQSNPDIITPPTPPRPAVAPVMVNVLTSSLLVGSNRYNTYKSMPATEASKIQNIVVTNPPAAPKQLTGEITWDTAQALLTSTNLADWQFKLATVHCKVEFTNSDNLLFYKVPAGSGNLAVSLAWDAPTDPQVAGHTVFYGTNSGAYSNAVPVPTDSNTVNIYGLNFGVTYYFVATANDASGAQSGYSNEVNINVPQEDDKLNIKLPR